MVSDLEVTPNEIAVLLKYGSKAEAIEAWKGKKCTGDNAWEFCVIMHWKGLAWLKEKC